MTQTLREIAVEKSYENCGCVDSQYIRGFMGAARFLLQKFKDRISNDKIQWEICDELMRYVKEALNEN